MQANSAILLASQDPALLSAYEPSLRAAFGQIQVVLSAEAALAELTSPSLPAIALLDTTLPGMSPAQLLSAVRAEPASRRLPIILFAEHVTGEWLDRLAEGVIDDLLPRHTDPEFLSPRLQTALRMRKLSFETELLREAADLNRQVDRLTGIYNREAMMSMLFRETDRVQRSKGSLCLILFDIDDFGHWNSRLGAERCDELLRQITVRSTRVLRSYDLLGRVGKDEFLVAMPGCTVMNAMNLAERIRAEVFSEPFRTDGDSIRLSACFGIASSFGRSPIVVLREAEQALQAAKIEGPESIQRFRELQDPATAPVTFRSLTSGDELLAW